MTLSEDLAQLNATLTALLGDFYFNSAALTCL